MGRVVSFQGGSKAVAPSATQTIVFTPQDLESAGLVNLMFAWGGTTVNTNAVIDRVRVRAGGDLLFDCTFAELQAYQQAYSKRMVGDLAANVFFNIPLHMMDAPREEDQDLCQFPPNREIQVEVVCTTGAGAGMTLTAGWVLSDVPPALYPRYYSQVLNFAAIANNQRFPFVEAGIIRGVTFAVAGISRAELFISGKSAFRLPGPVFSGATGAGDLLAQQDYFTNGLTQTTRTHKKVHLNLPASPGNSYLLMDTNGFAGTAEPMAIYSVVPLPKAAG